MGVYRLGYYPHNVHFVLMSAQMAGDGATAIATAQKLARVIPDERLSKAPGAQHIKASIYFAHAQFSSPETILALPDPGSSAAYVGAMWHYARGIAQVRRGDLTSAATEASAIGWLAQSPGLAPLTDAGIPAKGCAQARPQGRRRAHRPGQRGIMKRRSHASAMPPRSRIRCAIPGRPSGITRYGNRWRPRCCRPAS
jgi:hypothetical protein